MRSAGDGSRGTGKAASVLLLQSWGLDLGEQKEKRRSASTLPSKYKTVKDQFLGITVSVDTPGCKASIGHMVALICHKSINNLHLQDFF